MKIRLSFDNILSHFLFRSFVRAHAVAREQIYKSWSFIGQSQKSNFT